MEDCRFKAPQIEVEFMQTSNDESGRDIDATISRQRVESTYVDARHSNNDKK